MIAIDVKIINEVGLHARPASEFVNKALEFKADISIIKSSGSVHNGKSIVDILTAGIKKNESITIVASGDDENSAIETLSELVGQL